MRSLAGARRKRVPYVPTGRKLTPLQYFDLRGLDQVSPHDTIADYHSPYLLNARMFSRDDASRKVSVSTRLGPGKFSVPVGEAQNVVQTATTGASELALDTVNWIAQPFTTSSAGRLTKVTLNIKQGTDASGYVIVKVYTNDSGVPGTLIATSSVLDSDITNSYGYREARFIDAPALLNATQYWVVLYQQAGGTGTYLWSTTTAAATALISGNSGGTWATAGAVVTNFKTYLSDDTAPIGLDRYYTTTGDPETLLVLGTDVYSVSDDDGTATSIVDDMSDSATDYFFDFHEDIAYWVNGYDAPQQYDGTDVTDVGGTPDVSKFCAVHKNRLFLVPADDPTKIIFSDIGDLATYGLTNYLYVPSPLAADPIMQIISFQDALVIFTRNSKWTLTGNDWTDYMLREALGKRGLVGSRAADKDDNYLYFMSDDGFFRWGGSQDEYLSEAVEPELSNLNAPEKVHVRCWKNQVRIYYAPLAASNNSRMLLWDKTRQEWFLDTDVNIGMTVNLYKDDNKLVEASDLVGALYYAEQQHSILGKPIDFQYWTKYHNFGDSSSKKQVKRLYPLFRSQPASYEITLAVDRDLANSPRNFLINTQGIGPLWGTMVWGAFTWGQTELISPRLSVPGQAVYFQLRFIHCGAGQPVDILGYMMHARLKRPK